MSNILVAYDDIKESEFNDEYKAWIEKDLLGEGVSIFWHENGFSLTGHHHGELIKTLIKIGYAFGMAENGR